MKVVRYTVDNLPARHGLLEGNNIRELVNFHWSHKLDPADHLIPLDKVALLAPILPTQLVGLAYNYKDLVGDRIKYDEPLIFLKSTSGIIGPSQAIQLPPKSTCWVEVELGVVISQSARNLRHGEGEQAIFGFFIANDVTAANIHGRDHHLARSKALDSFAPVSTTIYTNIDVSNRRMITRINGKIFQDGTTSNMILTPGECIELVSQFITLQPGDVLFTGTPANAMNSIIAPGDLCQLEIDGLGLMEHAVVERRERESA